MAPPRTTAAEREREAREAAVRRRGLSARVGTVGVVLLFLGGIGTILSPENVATMIGVIVVGIVLVLAALLLISDAVRDVKALTKNL
ncbi:MAG: hypothetical protein A3K66_00370 [Euryarchaeota archaeon RBG_16_67_27]|nr:MAG: hypothetical protein A3K66_00370 [Euryarchaeota archaeon RBG_16_67_27]